LLSNQFSVGVAAVGPAFSSVAMALRVPRSSQILKLPPENLVTRGCPIWNSSTGDEFASVLRVFNKFLELGQGSYRSGESAANGETRDFENRSGSKSWPIK
jgi:hypothetical protein